MIRGLVVGPLLLVVLFASGCARRQEPMAPPTVTFAGMTPLQVLQRARTRMLDAGSAHTDFEYAIQGGLSISWNGDADLSFAAKGSAPAKERVSVDLPDLGVGPIGHVDWIVTGSVTYLRAKGLGALGARTRWLRIESAMGPRMRRYFGVIASQQNDPSQILDLLAQPLRVRNAGTQLIGSTYTGRFVGRVDVRGLLDALPGRTSTIREGLNTLLERLLRAGTANLPFEAWVDANGDLVEMRYSYPLAAATGTLDGKLTLTFAFSQLGDRFRIQAPPKDQVTDAATL